MNFSHALQPLRATRLPWAILALALVGLLVALPGRGAPTLSQQVDPPEASIGSEVVISYTIQNGTGANVPLPNVDGLQSLGRSSSTNITFNNGSLSSAFTQSFHVIPTRAGDFTIPAFDIRLPDGGVLHAQAMKLHVLATPGQQPSVPSTPAPVNMPPPFNPNGPVVMPPGASIVIPQQPPPQAQPEQQQNDAATASSGNAANGKDSSFPTDPDGRPAKVCLIITPQTTDAYVGESIPMKIEFYIRLDAAAQQDSLPTIKGSDFLMNSLSTRPREEELAVMNEGYHRETWYTAISAPKNGDFPLQMERDTYWRKSINPTTLDPFTNFFPGRPNLAHEMISSNQFTVHVHELPAEGRPAGFTGAIGQFSATGSAQPSSVAVGEPVTLRFAVSGQGNFDYVKCPVLADDPAWKTYTASSKMNYQEESHTQGIKNFEMAVIPQKNGTLPLPAADFSYFDPNSKQYVTIPINLPAITVTGSVGPAANPLAATADLTGTATATGNDLRPNRVDSGTLQSSLTPIYRQGWFWIVQGGLFAAVVLAALTLFIRSRAKPDNTRAERLQQQQFLSQELDAMSAAAQKGDALAFFIAARHAVQLKLGELWKLKSETITLSEIRQRDPELAQKVEPLFVQADEIIYSGGVGKGLDLAQWERHVLELLEPLANKS